LPAGRKCYDCHNQNERKKIFIFHSLGFWNSHSNVETKILKYHVFTYIPHNFQSESIAFLKILAEFESEASSFEVSGLSIILTIPQSDTTQGTLRHTSFIPKSDSTSVETDNILF
jgi:hypothetical protein